MMVSLRAYAKKVGSKMYIVVVEVPQHFLERFPFWIVVYDGSEFPTEGVNDHGFYG